MLDATEYINHGADPQNRAFGILELIIWIF